MQVLQELAHQGAVLRRDGIGQATHVDSDLLGRLVARRRAKFVRLPDTIDHVVQEPHGIPDRSSERLPIDLAGAHPVADTLAYGVKVSGATVHLVDAGVDTGPVVAQAAVEVHTGDTVDALHERIKIEERRLLVGTVAALALKGATVSGREVAIP